MKIANGMQFVNDEAVIGKWNNIGWIEKHIVLRLTD